MRTHDPESHIAPPTETPRSLTGDSLTRSSRDRHAGYLQPVLRTPGAVRERMYVGAAHGGMFASGAGRLWHVALAALALLAVLGLLFLGWRWHTRHRAAVRSRAVVTAQTPVAAIPARRAPSSPPMPAAAGVLTSPVTRIEIWKSERRLLAFAGGRPVKAFRIALGENAVGPKTREGDGRTPEGSFYICGRNPNGRYGPALGLAYPSPDDAAKGLAAGLIGEAESAAITDAWDRHVTPPWNTALGGSLFIQGNGIKSDWTHGSIAMEDAAVRELYKSTADGVVVVIHP